jgi:hypothetical protein
MIKDFINNSKGQIAISIILGLGLAALFRKVCEGNNCIVIQGPSKAEIEKYYYKVKDDCYKYTPYNAPCDRKHS